MTHRPGRIALVAIVVLAGLLRIGAIVYTRATNAAPEENRLIARNLADGRGFAFTEFGVTGPTAIRGPAYPMLLAVLGPDRVRLILAFNVVAGMATVLAAFALASRLLSPLPVYRGRVREGIGRATNGTSNSADPLLASPGIPGEGPKHPAPLIAAALFAIWPTQVFAATLTQGLSIAVMLTLAALALAFRRTPPALLAGGALAGLASLTEPMLALPLLLIALAIGWRRHWPDAALYLATVLVVVSPWLYRNAVVFGGPMPITSNFWRDAYLGNNPDATGFHWTARPAVPVDAATGKPLSRIDRLSAAEFDQLKVPEPQRVATFKKWTIDWIRQHPWMYVNLCLSRSTDTNNQSNSFSTQDRGVGRWSALFGMSRAAAACWPCLLCLLVRRNLVVTVVTSIVMIVVWPAKIALLWRRDVPELLKLAVLMTVGLALIPTFSLAVARTSVLMDIAQLLAIAALLGLWNSPEARA